MYYLSDNYYPPCITYRIRIDSHARYTVVENITGESLQLTIDELISFRNNLDGVYDLPANEIIFCNYTAHEYKLHGLIKFIGLNNLMDYYDVTENILRVYMNYSNFSKGYILYQGSKYTTVENYIIHLVTNNYTHLYRLDKDILSIVIGNYVTQKYVILKYRVLNVSEFTKLFYF